MATPSETGDLRTPRYACAASTDAMSCATIERTVSTESRTRRRPKRRTRSRSGRSPRSRARAVEEGPAGVSMIDSGVGLDRVRDRVRVRRRHLRCRALTIRCDGSSSRTGCRRRARGRRRRPRSNRRSGAARGGEGRPPREDGQVGGRFRTHDVCFESAPFQKPPRSRTPLDDVLVGHDVPLLVEDEAGSLGRLWAPPKREPSRAVISTTAWSLS